MAVTTAQGAKILDRLIDSLAGAACPYDTPGIQAAITATDTWVTNNQASFVAALASGASAFNSASTAQQKTVLFAYVILARAGLI